LFAEAIQEREEKILAAPAIAQVPNYAMFDLEAMPPHLDELDRIYLWGVQVFGEKPSEFMLAVAGFGPDGDREAWLTFLRDAARIVEIYGDIPFVHRACYEKTYLKKYIERYGDAGSVAARVIGNLLGLLPITRESVILPVPSFSLKVIEQYVGFKRNLPEGNSQWAMAKFIEATETSDDQRRRELMNAVLDYNRRSRSDVGGVRMAERETRNHFGWLSTPQSDGPFSASIASAIPRPFRDKSQTFLTRQQ
jgi:predicted RecB family nuclease